MRFVRFNAVLCALFGHAIAFNALAQSASASASASTTGGINSLQAQSSAGLRLHGTLAIAKATGGHQQDEYGFGGAALAAAEYGLGKVVGLQLELSALTLLEGDPPSEPGVKPESGASAYSGGLGIRFRPFGALHDGDSFGAAGFWLSGAVGGSLTGDLVRPMFDVQIGYDILNTSGTQGIGPMLGYMHVFQPDDEFRPADANIALIGVHAFFDFGPGLYRRTSDRDNDGFLDEVDNCPDLPEDKDGFKDTDGCPELDNDNDQILDKDDACPLEPEDHDGFEDKDGCPETDNDKDGLVDTIDKCPLEPEDLDDFEDKDGCPDPDNDKDGIVDAKDLCPNEPENINGYADSDGCPDEDQVRVVGDKILLDDRVHFNVNSHIIRRISYPLLERLAKLIKEHPEYVHIEVEGHADEIGPDDFNQTLSENRARSVMEFLSKQGIEAERLSSVGYGSTRPLVDKKSQYALFLNRRVEFKVTRKGKVGTLGAAPTPGTPDVPPPPPGEHVPGAAPNTAPSSTGAQDATPKPTGDDTKAPKKPKSAPTPGDLK